MKTNPSVTNQLLPWEIKTQEREMGERRERERKVARERKVERERERGSEVFMTVR